MKNRIEIAFSKAMISQVIRSMPADAMLIGGQSLSFWIDYYNIPFNDNNWPDVSKDMDILGLREHVAMIAQAINGVAEYPSKRAMTIIAGQIFIPAGIGQYMNIDVIHRMGNIDSEIVKKNAIKISFNGHDFFVMHPIDVLDSRVRNYYGIEDKQNEAGLRQVSLSIEVARRFIMGSSVLNESLALQAIERIFAIAKSPAGNYARRHGAEVFGAIHPSFLAKHISNENFIEHRLPRLESSIQEVLGEDAHDFLDSGYMFERERVFKF